MDQRLVSWGEGVIWEEAGTRVVVCSGSPGERAILLNPEASAVWRLCDGTRPGEEIVRELLEQYEAKPEVVERQVEAFVKDLVSKRLLTMRDETHELIRQKLEEDAVIFLDPAIWARRVGPEFTVLDNRRGVAHGVTAPEFERIWALAGARPTVKELLHEIETDGQGHKDVSRAWGKILLQIMQERGWIGVHRKSGRGEIAPTGKTGANAVSTVALHLQFHITGTCNLRCRHCYEDEAIEGEMAGDGKRAIIDKWIRQAVKWNRIPGIALTGGEPLLDSDFWMLLDYLEHHPLMGLHGYFAVLTNGTLIDGPIADRLAQYGRLAQVQVSLDGATSTMHDDLRGGGTFDKAVEAVGLLRERGVYTGIHFVVHKSNYRDAFSMTDLVRQLGANSLLVTRLVPWGRGKEMQALMLTPNEVRELYLKLVEDEKELANPRKRGRLSGGPRVVTNRCDFPLLFSDTTAPEELAWNGGHCLIGLRHLSVMQDGTAYACRRLPKTVGNILWADFEDVWNHEFLWQMRRKDLFMHGKCMRCQFNAVPQYRIFCQGGASCIANGYCGDPFSPDPQCSYEPALEEDLRH